MTDEQFAAVSAKWAPQADGAPSRLDGRGHGSRTSHLLSPFVRCGKCGAKMTGTTEKNHRGETEARYRCPSRGNGGCGGIAKPARPVEGYVKALVIAEQQKIQFRTLQEAPPWPGAKELAALLGRINEQQRRYEAGQIVNAERHFSSLARMEAEESRLKRERREWDKP